MAIHAYLFEAKSIQSYIFATNRLKEIVGASELVERLTDIVLDDVLRIVGGSIEWSRRGGGALYAFSADSQAIDRLADLWSLVVRQYAPDLMFVQARGQGATAQAAYLDAQPKLLAARNVPQARLPQAPPPVTRNRRTGEPAVGWSKKGEPVDAATRRKLNHRFWHGANLSKRFARDDLWERWPLNLTPDHPADDEDAADPLDEQGVGDSRDFPFQDEDRTLALVHADGNGLGQLLIYLGGLIEKRPDQESELSRSFYIRLFRRFSEAVTKATQQAAQTATREVLAPHKQDGVYPARPIVLGGDDVTILVRSDLALAFTRCFLTRFAVESEAQLQAFQEELDLVSLWAQAKLPTRLTACAGIAYAKASQPLYLLHGLAEGLCKHAKIRAKAHNKVDVPTSLSFHRVTTAFVDNYQQILERELTFGTLRQTLECYALEPGTALPLLDDLLALRALLADPRLSRGATRELLGLIGQDPEQAPRQYQRWREVMRDKLPQALTRFDTLLKQLSTVQPDEDLPYSAADDTGLRYSPLGDVVTLRSVDDMSEVQSTALEEAA
jgi:hypothetical protein